jgi:hypothetical protein
MSGGSPSWRQEFVGNAQPQWSRPMIGAETGWAEPCRLSMAMRKSSRMAKRMSPLVAK